MRKNSGTPDLIAELAGNLSQPSETKNLESAYWLRWGGAFVSFAIATLFMCWMWPDRARLPQNVFETHFILSALLWFGTFLVAARLAYLSILPLSHRSAITAALGGITVVLAVVIFSPASPASFAAELADELQLYRGPCGLYIGVTGLIAGTLLLRVMRRGAADNKSASGVWTLAAAGALSSFFMHLICRHETPGHAFIWHILPVSALILLGAFIATRLLQDRA